MSTTRNLVNLSSVGKDYAARMILEDVTLGISDRDRIGVVGGNGQGKSTLLELIAGNESPDEGQVIRVGGLQMGDAGLAAAWHLQLHGEAQYSVSRHVIWATCTSQLVVLLALWRAFAVKPNAMPSRLFLVVALVACAGFIVTGYYGGENVYHYGIGVHP